MRKWHGLAAKSFFSSGILFLLVIGTGFLLSNLGKPYNTFIFSLHKIISVIAVIITAIAIRNLHKNAEIKSVVRNSNPFLIKY